MTEETKVQITDKYKNDYEEKINPFIAFNEKVLSKTKKKKKKIKQAKTKNNKKKKRKNNRDTTTFRSPKKCH